MYEDMARWQTLRGLKPTGLHRRMTDALFRGLLVGCDACGGRGLLDQPPLWSVCAACRGLGSLFTVPPDVVSGIRQQIVDAFPQAAANPVRNFATAPVIHDLSRGVIASHPREDPHRDASRELAFQWWSGSEGVFLLRASGAFPQDRIRALRDGLGVSQAVFADLLNVSLSTVRAWEQGQRRPHGPSLRLLEVAEEEPRALLGLASLEASA
jgi:DNA-binding XRE family transcriptional regulator